MALLTSTLEDDSGDEVKEQETRQALEGDKIFRIRRPAENAAK